MNEVDQIILTEMPNRPIPWQAIPEDQALVKLQSDLNASCPAQFLKNGCGGAIEMLHG